MIIWKYEKALTYDWYEKTSMNEPVEISYERWIQLRNLLDLHNHEIITEENEESWCTGDNCCEIGSVDSSSNFFGSGGRSKATGTRLSRHKRKKSHHWIKSGQTTTKPWYKEESVKELALYRSNSNSHQRPLEQDKTMDVKYAILNTWIIYYHQLQFRWHERCRSSPLTRERNPVIELKKDREQQNLMMILWRNWYYLLKNDTFLDYRFKSWKPLQTEHFLDICNIPHFLDITVQRRNKNLLN